MLGVHCFGLGGFESQDLGFAGLRVLGSQGFGV